MKKIRSLKVMIAIFALSFLLFGCASNKSLAEGAAVTSLEEAGIVGYTQEGSTKNITSSDSESHQMIVKMRLLQYDMSPNLDDYDGTYLMDMVNEDGDTITVVVVNEGGTMKSLLPSNN